MFSDSTRVPRVPYLKKKLLTDPGLKLSQIAPPHCDHNTDTATGGICQMSYADSVAPDR